MEKLNIMLFCDAFFPDIDGVVHVIDNHARLLTKLGHNVIMVAPGVKGYEDNFPYKVIRCKGSRKKVFNYTIGYPNRDKEFKKNMEALPCDIIHIHSPSAIGLFGMKYAKKHNIPYVITFHSQFKRDIKRYLKFNFLTNLVLKIPMRVYNSANYAITMNAGCCKLLQSYKFKGKCLILPNATSFNVPENLDFYVNMADKTYGLKNKENVFIFVGRLVLQKNLLFIADVLKILKEYGLNFTMCFVGGAGGKDEAILKKRLIKNDVIDNVIFTGLLTDKEMVKAMFARADLFLFPSLYDMSSLVQIEAAAFKTPTVFTEGAVTASAVEKNVNGFKAPNDVNLYAKEVLRILSDKQELKRIGKNALKDLYIDWEHVVKKLENIYYDVIDEHNKKSPA